MSGWKLPVRTPLARIFEWCYRERGVDRLLLSARLDTDEKTPVLSYPSLDETVTTLFGDRLLERKLVCRWPGTKLIRHQGVVYLIDFDPSLIKAMAKLGRRLEDWRHSHKPPLPEDPCLFRQGDEWPVLVSVTHEREAWIFAEERPSFCLKKPSPFSPEEYFVPPAAEGFVGN